MSHEPIGPDLPYDLHEDLIDYPEAARLAGVPEPTVRQWKSRHHLDPAGKDARGRPLFRPIDVLRAEARTRANARRPRRGAA
ncbi:MerR family transcriptional regulator [Blastococcus sp. SYSU D00813]